MAKSKTSFKSTAISGQFRIPSRIRFPFGYRVAVKRVTPTDMVGVHSCKRCGHNEGSIAAGTWDDDTRIIYIDKSMPYKQQRAIFMHEFHHAYKDWELWVRQSGKAVD